MDSAPAAPSKIYSRSRGAFLITRKLIARGHNSFVYLAERNTDKTPYALKQVPRNNKRTENLQRLRDRNPARSALPRTTSGPSPLVVRRGTEEVKVQKEVAIMKKCDHPNIVKIQDFIDDPCNDSVYILMEYMQGGELQWRTQADQPCLTMGQIRRVMRDVVLGIEYLHMQGIIHRDIKPSNIMWNSDRSRVKIGDFGIAALVEAETMDGDVPRHAGTPSFLAPEIAPGGGGSTEVTFAVDLWALGVTLYAMLFGALPFRAQITDSGPVAAQNSLYRSICEDSWTPLANMSSQALPIAREDYGNGGVLFLLNGLLTKSPEERFDDEALRGMMTYGWLFADIEKPADWTQVTTPLFHPPLVSDPRPPSPPPIASGSRRAKKISVSKRDEANAISETKFKWPVFFHLPRRVTNLFKPLKAVEEEEAIDGRGRPRGFISNPEKDRSLRRRSSKSSGKGKAREDVENPQALANKSRKPARVARHSVEALSNTRANASGGVVLGSPTGPVNVTGKPRLAGLKDRTKSQIDTRSREIDLSRQRYAQYLDQFAAGEEEEETLRDGTIIGMGVGIGLIVMAKQLMDDFGSEDDELEERHISGPEDSDYGEDQREPVNLYGETSSDDEEGDAPIEFKRRVRPEPRGQGHGE
ncbi:Other/CAMKK/ELM protein kinase [Mycena indigotica]|uniref:Other/CAMKK/ELM protein kinase n=1 Tax=Mycena indigotica TaxID=2126181 RepID=A0A8H6T8I1_9AGAR|nr:Other/CAMKK/ELM protein kinase [Mycena indigotica]KAF7312724.1 Other/CAMKK/ELM protein kinase [Mycena indigotica]